MKSHFRSSPVIILLRSVLAFCLLASQGTAALAQVTAAKVMAVAGSVKAVDAQGIERKIEKGGEIRTGDKIVTADGGLVQLRLNDGGFMSVRPGTEMVIDRFVFDEKNAGKSSFLVSLVRGGFRSITGLIGRLNPDAYQIRAGTSTVGIRGTDHEPMMIPEGIPTMAQLGAPGLYDKVNSGETFIRNPLGLLSLKRGEVGFTPISAKLPPQALTKIPDFYKLDVKVDARDPKDAQNSTTDERKSAVGVGGLLRPTTAARREALLQTEGGTTTLRSVADTSLMKTGAAPVSSDLVIKPTTTLIAPTTTLIAPTTTYIAPTTTLIAPTTTYIAPTTTYIAPTTTLISPISTSTTLLK